MFICNDLDRYHYLYQQTYSSRNVRISIFFRPNMSASDPKMSDPNITPAKKILIDNGESQVRSQINDHSEF